MSFFSAVVPNSASQMTLILLFASFVLSFLLCSSSGVNFKFLLFWIVGVVLTLIYIIVGLANGAPAEAALQVLFIYIVSPLLWFIVISAALKLFDDEAIFKFFQFVLFLSILTVPIFFYLFINHGPASVDFFMKGANVNLNDGYAGATMHVYGTFIFFAGAFLSAPDLFESKARKMFFLVAIVSIAFTSGRSALMMSVFLGCFIFFMFPKRFGVVKNSGKFVNFIWLISGSFFLSILFFFKFGIDFGYIFDLFLAKVSSGGGGARSEQFSALLESILQQHGLGVGHGVGVEYIRSLEHPWRYELIWLATLHRVGLLGAIIYSLPFVYYLFSFARLALKQQVQPFDRFLFGGFVCVFFASNTNPYIEGFTFQWMYLIPVIHLLERKYHRGDPCGVT